MRQLTAMLRRVVVPALAALAGALTLPADAHGAMLLQHLPIAGTTKAGSFLGRISIQQFSLLDGRLIAIALLTGTVRDARYPGPQAVLVRALRMPVRVETTRGKRCSALRVTLGPENTRLFGLPGTLAATRLSLNPNPHTQRSLASVACLIGRASKADDTPALLRSLNSLRHLRGAGR